MTKCKQIELVSASEMNAKHPTTFHLPSTEDMGRITKGTNVKVCYEDQAKDTGERFWVMIHKVMSKGKLRGRVNNVIRHPKVRFGDLIEFSVDNVYEVAGDIQEMFRASL